MVNLSDIFVGKKNNLTFIRLFAALSVIYGHAYAVVPGYGMDWVARTTSYAFAGGVAVDLFFLISGFLVTASIFKGGIKHYIISRLLRIYPALWVNLIIVTFIFGTALTTFSAYDYLTNHEVWSYFLGLAGTYRGGFFLPGVFLENHNHAVNGSIWSVLIEVWLYIITLVFYLLGILKSRALFNVIFFVLIIALWSDSSWIPGLISGSTNLHVCLMFYIGAFLFINRDTIPVSPYYLLFALFLAGMTIGTDRFLFAYILVLVAFFCAVSFYAQFAWIDKFGDFSYGVYLYGWPIQQILTLNFPTMSALENTFFSGCLALVCGGLSWHFIEKPMLAIKRYF